MIVEELNSKNGVNNFDLYFNLLKIYKKKHGNCDVPQGYEMIGARLGSFVNYQRVAYKKTGKYSITKERIDKLNSIGFEWESILSTKIDISEQKWKRNIRLLKKYKKINGHLLVPYHCKLDGYRLGQIVGSIRQAYKGTNGTTTLSQERIDELNSIGFIWDARKYRKDNNIK